MQVAFQRVRGLSKAGGRSASEMAQLRQSQDLWNRWQSFDCAVQASRSKGGTLYPLELLMCLSDHTAARALELERLAEAWDH